MLVWAVPGAGDQRLMLTNILAPESRGRGNGGAFAIPGPKLDCLTCCEVNPGKALGYALFDCPFRCGPRRRGTLWQVVEDGAPSGVPRPVQASRPGPAL
jgi:hypothetical protein